MGLWWVVCFSKKGCKNIDTLVSCRWLLTRRSKQNCPIETFSNSYQIEWEKAGALSYFKGSKLIVHFEKGSPQFVSWFKIVFLFFNLVDCKMLFEFWNTEYEMSLLRKLIHRTHSEYVAQEIEDFQMNDTWHFHWFSHFASNWFRRKISPEKTQPTNATLTVMITVWFIKMVCSFSVS